MYNLQEWGKSSPHEYLSSYRLEGDMSWTPVSKILQRDYEMGVLNHILDGSRTLGSAIGTAGDLTLSIKEVS